MEKKLFLGIGAKLVPGSGADTKFKVVAQMYNGHAPPTSDPATAIDLDLDRSPDGVRRGKCVWKDVQIDDRGINYKRQRLALPSAKTDPPDGVLVTTVGPKLDQEAEGGAYLEHRFFVTNRKKIFETTDPLAVWPPLGFEVYEYATIAYSDDAAANPVKKGMRFVGFKAWIIERRDKLVKVQLRWAGNEWRGPFWLDLDNLADCDASPGDLSDPDDPVHTFEKVTDGKAGALFIRMERASELAPSGRSLRGPKLPIGQG